ncbi:hypothetical protein ACWKSP_08145 [Micromonosporaceae bacterium Da 78-11]
MTDFGNNGMFEPARARKVLDLDGALVEDTGPENPAFGVNPDVDTDGTPVGAADAEADAHPHP